ncbi:MAG: hypothetical protein JO362_10445 [Streptomycetaceae bacterium]|nr:hypothetical protein [Streptomycetaceae bacterium]
MPCTVRRHRSYARQLRTICPQSSGCGGSIDSAHIETSRRLPQSQKHNAPKPSQRTRAGLTFFALDHSSTEMVYANADITKPEQARKVIASPTTGGAPPEPTPGCY